jgi:hypothetical protein
MPQRYQRPCPQAHAFLHRRGDRVIQAVAVRLPRDLDSRATQRMTPDADIWASAGRYFEHLRGQVRRARSAVWTRMSVVAWGDSSRPVARESYASKLARSQMRWAA